MQVFVSKEQMMRAFGRDGVREVATAKSAFKKSAAFVPSRAFMFASTNLVFELGLVLWLLMGWRFILAEFVGAFVLIGVMWLIVLLTLPKNLVAEARAHKEEETNSCCARAWRSCQCDEV